jgi:hypothetical protein
MIESICVREQSGDRLLALRMPCKRRLSLLVLSRKPSIDTCANSVMLLLAHVPSRDGCKVVHTNWVIPSWMVGHSGINPREDSFRVEQFSRRHNCRGKVRMSP